MFCAKTINELILRNGNKSVYILGEILFRVHTYYPSAKRNYVNEFLYDFGDFVKYIFWQHFTVSRVLYGHYTYCPTSVAIFRVTILFVPLEWLEISSTSRKWQSWINQWVFCKLKNELFVTPHFTGNLYGSWIGGVDA